jgi:heptosyltransferase-2
MNAHKMPAGVIEKILIIRLSSIGDILLSTPFIRQVRQKFPGSQIDYVIKDVYKDLIKHNPHINQIYTVRTDDTNSDLIELKQTLEKQSYNIVFDLHNNLRSNFLKRGINAEKIRSIRKGKIKQSLLVWFKINKYDEEISIPERYLAVAKDFDVEDDGKGLEIFLDDTAIESAEEKTISNDIDLNKSFVCLAPGAGFFTKRWPDKKFKQLINNICEKEKLPIVVFGGTEDQKIGAELGQSNKSVDFCGKLSLLETAYIISKGNALVSNDSGLMHMATAVHTPVLAIFGSTVRELGFFPYRSESRVIENIDLSCRPCSHIGRHKCPKGHFKCMEDIPAERVYEELSQLL